MNDVIHRRRMQASYFRSSHDEHVEFMAQAMIEGFCEAPDMLIACPAVEMYAPASGAQAGKWHVLNASMGEYRTLTSGEFAHIGGFIAEPVR